MISSIVAHDINNGISHNGKIPWDISEDRKLFKKITSGAVVIMGRTTFESIGRPLPDRTNIVISSTMDKKRDDIHVVDSPQMALLTSLNIAATEKKQIFVIGGSAVYEWFNAGGHVTREYVTEINVDYKCDNFYKPSKSRKLQQILMTGCNYSIVQYSVDNHEEMNFIELGKKIMGKNNLRIDRTLVGCYSLFGAQLEFDIQNYRFPLLTTRAMYFRGIFEELMMYIRGQTNSDILAKKAVNVWEKHTSREFLDKCGLKHLPVGDMGPSYGFLFRHFGASYVDCKTNYENKGVDQLTNAINLIKKDPTSRRIIISLWDPSQITNCPLPPCLHQYQFFVDGKSLSCMMTQRSSDFPVAGGWNVATGALLTILIAATTNLEPHRLIWNIGDIHIYKNLKDAFSEQLMRVPFMWPHLVVKKKDDITKYEYSDIKLIGYNHHPTIKFEMNV